MTRLSASVPAERARILYLGGATSLFEGGGGVRASSFAEAMRHLGTARFTVLVVELDLTTASEVARLAKVDPEMSVLLAANKAELAQLGPAARQWQVDGVVPLPVNRNDVAAAIDTAMRVGTRVAHCVKLYESCRSLFGSLKQRDLVRTVVDVGSRVVAAESVALFLVSSFCEPPAAFECHASAGLAPKARGLLAEATRLVLDRGVLLCDDPADPLLPRADGRWLACPLFGADGPGGAVVFLRDPDADPFSPHEQQAASTFAATVTLALENAQDYRELEGKIRTLTRDRQRLVSREAVAISRNLGGAIGHEVANAMTIVGSNVDAIALVASDTRLWEAAKEAAEYLLLQGEPTGQRLASRIMATAGGRDADGLVTEIAVMIDECLEGVRRVAEMTRFLGIGHAIPSPTPRVPLNAAELLGAPAVMGAVVRRPVVVTGSSSKPLVAAPADMTMALANIFRALDSPPGAPAGPPLVVRIDDRHGISVIEISDPTPQKADQELQQLLTPTVRGLDGVSFRFDASLAIAHALLARNELDIWVELRAEGGIRFVIASQAV